MDYDENRWAQIEELFEQAVDLPPDDAAAFCKQACGDDVELYKLLTELVQAADMGDEVLRESVSAVATDIAQQSLLTGERVGAYRLDELISRGGMGAVYLASRADGEFEKQVVVKLILQKLNHDEFVRHFKTERQVLANLNHPYIPALVDAGQLDDGRPYFVADYVKGLPIDEYCDANALSRRQRIALIEKLGQAVQHAHNKLILHLDIKPANILVTKDGTPRLLDFGIARLMGDPDSGHKAFTPDYASPEQVRGESPTAASDIYSLGVLLYRLIAGNEPFRASRFSPQETKLAERAELAQTISEPDPLPGADADLCAIVRKAMAPAVGERYASVESFLLDLKLRRNHRPIAARHKTYPYRLTKFLRRNALGLIVVAGVMGLSVAFAVREFQLRQSAQASSARADREAEAARQVSTFLTDIFEVSDPGESRGNSVTARELLDKGAARIEEDLADQPLVAGQLMHTIGQVYVKLGLFDQSIPLLQNASSLHASAGGGNALHNAEVLHTLGDVLTRKARFEEAEQALSTAIAIRERAPGMEALVASSLEKLGQLYMRQGRGKEAEAVHLRGIALQEQSLGQDHADYGQQLAALGRVYYQMGRNDESEIHLQRALGILERAYDPDHPNVANIVENLGNLYNHTRDFDKSEEYLLRSLGMRERHFDPDHPFVSYSLMNVAALYANAGKLDQAQEHLLRALAIQQKVFEPDDYRISLSRSNLGDIYFQRGLLDDAEREGLAAVVAFEKKLEPGHAYLGFGNAVLARVYHAKGDFANATTYFEKAYAYFGTRPADDPNRMEVTGYYVEFLREAGRDAQADALENPPTQQ